MIAVVESYLKGYALRRQPLLAPRGCHLGGLGLEQDDGKHSLESLELQLESVSFLNRGVWGGWAGAVKEWWDFPTGSDYRFELLLTGKSVSWVCWFAGRLSLILFGFLEGPSLDPLAPARSKRSFSFSSRPRNRQGFLGF